MPISLHVTATDLTMFGLTGSIPQEGPICFKYNCNTSHRRHSEVNILSLPATANSRVPLYLDKVCPVLYRWKEITGLPEPGPALAVSLRWVWPGADKSPAPAQGRVPCAPHSHPSSTAPPGTDPGCGWSRGMLLFIWSQWMWAALSMAVVSQGSRACAALRSRTVPGLGSAPQAAHGLKELCWGSCLALITALLAALSKYINRPL